MNSTERAGLRPKGNVPNIGKVPNLRFPEFSGEWLATTIDGVTSEFQSGKFIKADLIQSKGSVPVYGGNGLRGYTDTYNHIGDYVLIGRQGALCGNVRFVTGETYITEHAIAVKGTEDNDTKYLQYLLERMNLGQYSDQSAQPGLAVSKLIKLKITIPPKREQSKIARLLTVIDERITTQIRIIEDLKLFRSAIYQKVFSSMHGEAVALCKITDIIKGKQINGTELYDTGDYYVMNGGIVPSGYYNDYNTPANTISISEGGNSCGYVQFNDVPFWSGGHCYTLSISSSQIDLRYLFHYLKYREQDIMALRIGSGLPNIQKKNLERFQILIPTFDEQHRYAKIFDSLQHKEVVEASLLNKWQTQKQYLLRQMFI